jgi:hypothetical protein
MRYGHWYNRQKVGVQAAIAGGVVAIVGAIITGLFGIADIELAKPSQPASASTLTASAPAPSSSGPANLANSPAGSNSGTCIFGYFCLAADGTLLGGAHQEQYTNDPDVHVAGLNTPPAADTLTIGGIPAAGTYTLFVYFENNVGSDGLTQPRDMTLLVNGHTTGLLDFAVTGSWYETSSKVTTAVVQVPPGTSTFAIACQVGDSCHVNLWKIELTR